jgi:murein DD-endopeptidase MepM/ murein hydrolase activator NlpD
VFVIRWFCCALAIIIVLAMGAYQQQQVPATTSCGQVAGGSAMTVKGVQWARSVGQWMRDWATKPMPSEDAIRFYINGVTKDVLWYWLTSGLDAAHGKKVDPQILKLERDAAAAGAAADKGCTPCPPASSAPDVPVGPGTPPVDRIDAALYADSGARTAEQKRIIAEAVSIRKARGLDPQADLIITATGLVESEVHNTPEGDRDSIGWLQQRTSQGWGTLEQLSNTAYQTRKFFDALVKVPGWRTRPPGDVAQAVQRSAYPDKYGRRLGDARALLAAVGDVPAAPDERTPQDRGGVQAPIMCAAPDGSSTDGNNIVDTQIVVPAAGPYSEGYKGHTGVDFAGAGADMGDPFRAAAAGTVTHVGGGKGYGQAVIVMTDMGYETVYGHASRIDVTKGQRVTAGTQLGLIGNTGNSTGPHLHFEARTTPGVLGTQQGSIDFLAGKWRPKGGTVAAASAGARRVKDAVTGNVYSIPIPAGAAGRAMNNALDQVGDVYVWGSHGPDSWDCSGLVGVAWQKAGVRMPTHQSAAQRAGIPLVQTATPGDLLYKPGHIQMFLGRIGGETLILEAPKPGDRVRIRAQWMTPTAILDPTLLGVSA